MAQLPARRSARNITLVDPSREFEDIYERMGQLMSMAFGDLAFTPGLAAAWTPLADISETDDAYLVEVELPGVNKDQVNVNVNDRELVITGEIEQAGHPGAHFALAVGTRVDPRVQGHHRQTPAVEGADAADRLGGDHVRPAPGRAGTRGPIPRCAPASARDR